MDQKRTAKSGILDRMKDFHFTIESSDGNKKVVSSNAETTLSKEKKMKPR